MSPKERARRYREWLRKHTAEDLYKGYKKRVRPHIAKNLDAVQQVHEIIKTVKVYEEYVKRLEGQYREELKKTKTELSAALRKVKELQDLVRKHGLDIRDLREKDAQKPHKGAKRGKKVHGVREGSGRMEKRAHPSDYAKIKRKERELRINQRRQQALKRANEKFERMQADRRAAARGDNPAEAVGRRSHESKDVYADILDRLESERQLYFTASQKGALSRSGAFRQALHDRFRSKLTDKQMDEIWDRNFGEGSGAFTVNKPKEGEEKINWTYIPKNRRK